MVEQGWQPKQVYKLLDKYNIIDNLGGNRAHLVKALGEKGLADLLANLLKKGGKINKNETKKSI